MTTTFIGNPPECVKQWILKRHERIPLCFTALQAGSTVQLTKVRGTFKTSSDGRSWTDYTIGTAITLSDVGDKVYFSARTENETIAAGGGTAKFVMTGSIAASGNMQYLLDSTGKRKDVPNGDYDSMFADCTSLTTAPVLPATTLSKRCYFNMFYNCTSLTSAPALPATTLADQCYQYMFQNCTSLTAAPALPATTLSDVCYGYMFQGCTSLTSAPALPATTLAVDCYYYMFQGCTSLTSAPALPATTLASYCYYYMFQGCTSLTSAPALPATTLANTCYGSMFRDCPRLSNIEVNFTTWPSNNACIGWLSTVAPSGTFIKPAALPDIRGTSNIPNGWTVVNK